VKFKAVQYITPAISALQGMAKYCKPEAFVTSEKTDNNVSAFETAGNYTKS